MHSNLCVCVHARTCVLFLSYRFHGLENHLLSWIWINVWCYFMLFIENFFYIFKNASHAYRKMYKISTYNFRIIVKWMPQWPPPGWRKSSIPSPQKAPCMWFPDHKSFFPLLGFPINYPDWWKSFSCFKKMNVCYLWS